MPRRRSPIARYPYRDTKGRVLYKVLRYEPKEFAIVDARGRPLPDPLPSGTRILYRLPELRASGPAETVHLTEGEKDADCLASLGLVATTMPCGTRGGWSARYTAELRGRHVAILPDADGPGRRHAELVEGSLRGAVASVVIVDLWAGRRGARDVTDWITGGHDATDLAASVRRARFRLAGIDRDRPTKRHKVALVLGGELSTTEKFLLFVREALREWSDEARLPSIAATAKACSVHRVTASKVYAALRARGILSGTRSEAVTQWDILAAIQTVPPIPEAAEEA